MFPLDSKNEASINSDIFDREGNRSTKWYYLAFEGDNESNYFKLVKDNKKKLGISDNVGCIRLYRFESEKHNTDPKWIKMRVDDYKEYLRGHITPRLFLEFVLMEFRKKAMESLVCRSSTEYEKKVQNMDSDIHGIEEDILDKIEGGDCVDSNNFIDDSSEALSIIRKALREQFPEYKKIVPWLTNPSKQEASEEDLSDDRFCVIVDRDHYCDSYRLSEGESVKDYYKNLLDFFNCSDVSLYVTNPCFEFWLILHFEDFNFEMDEALMLENPIEINKKRYSENTLKKRLPDYSKVRLDGDEIVGKDRNCKRILNAIQCTSDNYTTDLILLKDHLGSNVGLLLREMQGN